MITISVITASTRENRFSEHAARWILGHLERKQSIEARLLDLREYPLPFFDAPTMPAMEGHPPFGHKSVEAWTKAIEISDGFIFATPEYNHGPPAVLKNALDWVYKEWNRKPAAFVSWGTQGGARSVHQLYGTLAALQLAPVPATVQIPFSTVMTHANNGDIAPHLAELDEKAEILIKDLLWWTEALKAAR